MELNLYSFHFHPCQKNTKKGSEAGEFNACRKRICEAGRFRFRQTNWIFDKDLDILWNARYEY